MSKGQDYYRKQIIKKSPIQVFSASNTAMLNYPYVLGRPDEKSPTLSSQSDVYVMDSGIGDKTFNNDDVLDKAKHVSADIVIPKDVLDDTEETTKSVVDMIVRDNGFDIWVPLQCDERLSRVEHYYELSDVISDIGDDITNYRVAIGGIRDYNIEDQIIECKRVSDRLPNNQDIHAFGCGFNKEWVVAIRKQPGLLDSLDTSSHLQYVNNGRILDCSMEVKEHKLPRGTNSTVLNVMVRERMLYMFNYLIGTDVRESDTVTSFDSDILSEEFNI